MKLWQGIAIGLVLSLGIATQAEAYSFLHYSIKYRYPHELLIPPRGPSYRGPRYIYKRIESPSGPRYQRGDDAAQRRYQNDVHQTNTAGTIYRQPDNLIRFQRQVFNLNHSPRRLGYQWEAIVERVDYGGAIVVRMPDGSRRGIRILGLDAPEPSNGRGGDECFARESIAALSSRILNQPIVMEKEDGYHRDNYDRYVRYIKHGGRDVGKWMIRNGYGFADQDHEHRRKADYTEEQTEALRERRGLWSGVCHYNDNPGAYFF